jgi:hypothetical protein
LGFSLRRGIRGIFERRGREGFAKCAEEVREKIKPKKKEKKKREKYKINF